MLGAMVFLQGRLASHEALVVAVAVSGYCYTCQVLRELKGAQRSAVRSDLVVLTKLV